MSVLVLLEPDDEGTTILETSLNIYQSTRRNILKYLTFLFGNTLGNIVYLLIYYPRSSWKLLQNF